MKDLSNSVVELYSHPACIDGKHVENYTRGRLTMDGTVGKFLEDHKDSIEIITYSDLL